MVALVVQMLSDNFALQALEDGKLELTTAFLVVQEMIAHWPQTVTYISNTSQRQEFQYVEGRVRVVCVLLHVSNQMLMVLCYRVKHLIVKSLGIPTSKLVWNCLKSSFKIIVKPSSGQLCPVVTKGFSCAAKCAIFCIVYCEGSCRGVVYLLNGIGMRCDFLILLLVSYWASLNLCRRQNFVQRC